MCLALVNPRHTGALPKGRSDYDGLGRGEEKVLPARKSARAARLAALITKFTNLYPHCNRDVSYAGLFP